MPTSQGLADFYTAIGNGTDETLDLKRIERVRPQIARLLHDQTTKPDSKGDEKRTENPARPE